MENNEFIFTKHADERFTERFPELSKSEEVKNVTTCNSDEIYHLRNSNAYKKTKTKNKPNIFHFKSSNGVYFICEKKLQTNKNYYAQIVITVIDLNNDEDVNESQIDHIFLKQMILSNERLDRIGKLSYNQRFPEEKKKKEKQKQENKKNIYQASPYKYKKHTMNGKYERAVNYINNNLLKEGDELRSLHIDEDNNVIDLYFWENVQFIKKFKTKYRKTLSFIKKTREKEKGSKDLIDGINHCYKLLEQTRDSFENINMYFVRSNNLYEIIESFNNDLNEAELSIPQKNELLDLYISNNKLRLSNVLPSLIDFKYNANDETYENNNFFNEYLENIISIHEKILKINKGYKNIERKGDAAYKGNKVNIKNSIYEISLLLIKSKHFKSEERYKGIHEDFLMYCISQINKYIKTFYKKDARKERKEYLVFYNIFSFVYKNYNNLTETLDFSIFMNFITKFQIKDEISRIHNKKFDVLLRKEIIIENLNHLELISLWLKEKNYNSDDSELLIGKINNITPFYKLVKEEMESRNFDSFYIKDYI